MKVVLAFDGSHFSEGAFEFARRLNQKNSILLTGVFIPPFAYMNAWSHSNLTGDPLAVPQEEAHYPEIVKKTIDQFEKACLRNRITYSIHREESVFETPDLKKETRFADLIILGSESFYKYAGGGVPSQYVTDALHTAECPVLVVPEQFEFPESNILAYDGSASSVYAIRQFAYLFPELCKQNTLLIYAHEKECEIPDEAFIEELAASHFPNLTLFRLDLDPKKYFADWIREKKTALLVSGSFGRSTLSNILKKSFVLDIIKDHALPVFITHK
jgi:nucleotide-binding universal stress UspA family protein